MSSSLIGVDECQCCSLELRTGGNESLTGSVVLVFVEVFDEASCEVFGLDIPVFDVGVGVARVEDLRIYAGQFGGYFKVEDGHLLGGSLKDGAVEDCIDYATSVADGCLLYTSPSPRD